MTREIHQGPEPICSRRNFLDETVLIGYDGTNMPYIMFYNQIMNLLYRCYYSDRKLALLRAACVRTAAQTIDVVISDTPGFKDDTKITMASNRLAQRFGVRGSFLNEPEVRKIRNTPKMSNSSVDAWKAFKDELTQCFVFAHSYKQPGQLKSQFVVNLARRLPIYAKQRFLYYLNDCFGCTSDLTFDNSMDFVMREEKCKASDFGVQLMTEENQVVMRNLVIRCRLKGPQHLFTLVLAISLRVRCLRKAQSVFLFRKLAVERRWLPPVLCM